MEESSQLLSEILRLHHPTVVFLEQTGSERAGHLPQIPQQVAELEPFCYDPDRLVKGRELFQDPAQGAGALTANTGNLLSLVPGVIYISFLSFFGQFHSLTPP